MAQTVYRIAVLGAGPGGYVAAIRASQLGASVVLVEERELGGTCLNRGCIPTKALLDSLHVLELARNGKEFGVACAEPKPDLARMNERKEQICAAQRKGIESLLKTNQVAIVNGRGVLRDRNNIIVRMGSGEQTVTAERIIIATGSEPARPAAFAFDGSTVITSDEALRLDTIPASILIIGGGAIGCEWAGIFRALGADVTVVEMMEQLLPNMDGDVARELFKSFRKAGIKVHVKTRVESVEQTAAGVTATLTGGQKVPAEKILVSVGRKLNSDGIGLEAAGVASERGAIVIDDHCRTNVPGIFAIGDVTGKLLLAHLASAQGEVAAQNAAGKDKRIDYRVVPSCVFTHPEIGCVGLTVEEAEKHGLKVKSVQYPFRPLGRARTLGSLDGFFKIVADAGAGEVLGVHVIGPCASDLVAEAALAMRLEATVEEIAETIHAHPTLAEGMMEAARLWLGRAVHA